jgi:hypothetical protein
LIDLITKIRGTGLLKKSEEESLYLDPQGRLVWLPLEGVVGGHIIQDISDFKLVKRRREKERSIENAVFLVMFVILTSILPDAPSATHILVLWAPFWFILFGVVLFSSYRPVTLLRTQKLLFSPRSMAQYEPVRRRRGYLGHIVYFVGFIGLVLLAIFSSSFRLLVICTSPGLLVALIMSIRSLITDNVRGRVSVENRR